MSSNAGRVAAMFGPLNGVRTALVIGAAMAAIVAAILGQWIVTAVLLLGVAGHGLGWLYLYRQQNPHRQGPHRQPRQLRDR